MLLRSSSTPVLGSLLSSFADSPSNSSNCHQHDTANHIFKNHQSLNKLPYYQLGCRNLLTISCNSSPISPSFAEFSNHSQTGFRRAQSEGNLEGLAYSSCNSNEENHNSSQPKKFSGRPKCAMLDTIPSFSFCNSRIRYEDDDEEEDDDHEEEWSGIEDDKEEKEQWKEKAAMHAGHFGLSNDTDNMVLSEKVRVMDRTWNAGFQEKRSSDSEELHLAEGLGVDGGITNGNGGGCGRRGGGSGGEFNSAGGDDEYINGTEEYYKRLIQENPSNALFLRNYAQFLYQSKQDLRGAEEYYARAILADPNDGEILSQYAKLVWELHCDQDRASSYFEHAVRASPKDSHVHAAYASFLWETEEDEGECLVTNDFDARSTNFPGAVASTGA